MEIISHNLLIKEGDEGRGSGVVLNLKNIAGADIGKAVFKSFYMAPEAMLWIPSKSP
jgi:hypothetical protein